MKKNRELFLSPFCLGFHPFSLFCFLLMGVFATLLPSEALGAESVKIVKLKMQSPSSMATVLRQTFGRDLRVAEAPMVNGVVISSDDEKTLLQAEAMIAQLDKEPATLRYSIQSSSHEQINTNTMGGSVKIGTHGKKTVRFQPDMQTHRVTSSGGETRMVVGLEGEPVGLSDVMMRVETLNSPWGPQDSMRSSEQGLKISGRLVGAGNEVMVEVWYAEGGFDASRQLMTQVKVPLGTWFNLGGLASGGDSASRNGGIIRSSGNADRTIRTVQGSSNYLIKIDRVK